MAKYSNTKAKINEKITTNSAQAITGNILNDVLQTMVDSLGADYQFGGLVQPGSTFTAGEQPVVFLATTPGTYTNFGGLVVADGEVALLVWSGTAWSKQIPDIATRTEVSQLGQKVSIADIVLNQDNISITMQEGKYYDNTGAEVVNEGSIYSGKVDISSFKAKSIIIAYKATEMSVSGRSCLILDANSNILEYKFENDYTFLKGDTAYMVLSSESTIGYVELSFRKQNSLLKCCTYSNTSLLSLKQKAEQLETINGIKWIDGELVTIYGEIVTNAAPRFRSELIPCAENATIKYIAETNHQLVAGISFWDVYGNFISSYNNNGTLNEITTVTSPAKTAYCILSGKGSDGNTKDVCTLSSNKSGTINALNKVKESITNMMIQPLLDVATKNYFKESIYVTKDSVTSVGETYTIAQGGYIFFNMPITGIVKEFIKVAFTLVSGDLSDSKCRIWDGSTSAGEIYKSFEHIGNNCYVCEVPVTTFTQTLNTFQVRLDARNISGSLVIKDVSVFVDGYFVNVGDSTTDSVFVATNGSDSNSGSSISPFATLNKAVSSGAKHIYIKGGTYQQKLNLQDSANDITIESYEYNKRVIFINPDSLISSTETAVSGYTKVYSCPCSLSPTQWIFQDGIADVSTLISDAERNPYQRGYTYRCEDTKIVQCSSATLSDALAEIEAASVYKWYLDSGTLYFSRPQALSAANPLRYGDGNFISNSSRNKHLTMRGIEVKYMSFNVTEMSGCLIEDCKVSNVRGGGGFVYNKSLSVKFVRCEASRVYYDTVGDGFNGHSSNTGDVFSKQTTCMLIDCWSHDNNDDGYSDHERSEIEIYGGLFEYNGKAGVTPSYGSHCSCYGVISRRNYNGFYYVGEVDLEEGGKYGQMLCVNCVAENNGCAGQEGIGFGVTSNGNKAILVSCKSLNNSIGYYAGANTIVKMIDCGSLNNTDVKYGDGTFTIENTTIVS